MKKPSKSLWSQDSVCLCVFSSVCELGVYLAQETTLKQMTQYQLVSQQLG